MIHPLIWSPYKLFWQALFVPELDDVGTLRKPDFVTHPHRYFRDREDIVDAKVLAKEPDDMTGQWIILINCNSVQNYY